MEQQDQNNKQCTPLNEEELNDVNGGFSGLSILGLSTPVKQMYCPKCHLALRLWSSEMETLNAHYSSGQCKGSVYVF